MAAFLTLVLGKSATAADKDRRFPLPEGDAKQALLVVPASTLGNWQRELRTWGCFRIAVLHGGRVKLEEAKDAAIDRNCEIVLTTYMMRHSNRYMMASLCRIYASSRDVVTGTPR